MTAAATAAPAPLPATRPVPREPRLFEAAGETLEDEATVKRFYREKDRVRLQPANKAYKPIRTRDARVLGRVVGVYRSI